LKLLNIVIIEYKTCSGKRKKINSIITISYEALTNLG